MSAFRHDPGLTDAAIRVLARGGWAELTLERVAEEAGSSRTTLWRQGVTRETLTADLLGRLAQSYRDALWPIVTASGSGRERLAAALEALCDVADEHLALLSATDTAFHEVASATSVPATPFVGALERLLRDGAADGTLIVDEPVRELAVVLFNAVCWTYVHMRARHGWGRRRARRQLLELLLRSLTPPA